MILQFADLLSKSCVREANRNQIFVFVVIMDRPYRREPFRTQVVALGRLRLASIDNVSESLAVAEGEAFK